ncbi:MAG TPA: acylphosphatase [Armatimonadetes bacterium]|nr:acylphosphatase [Armatimonadota bacterium]
MGKARMRAIVKGIVQGVGYRFFVEDRAYELGLTGYVRNLPDGTVEVVAEGDKEVLELLLEHLRRGPRSARVTDVEVEWGEVTGEFKDFRIRF